MSSKLCCPFVKIRVTALPILYFSKVLNGLSQDFIYFLKTDLQSGWGLYRYYRIKVKNEAKYIGNRWTDKALLSETIL